MPFVRRNAVGEIIAVSESEAEDFQEELPPGDHALAKFLHDLQPGAQTLQTTDLGFIRVLEDVIDLLIDKGLIDLAELPEDARNKIRLRQQLRGELRGKVGR